MSLTTRARKSFEYGFAIHAGPLAPVRSLNQIRWHLWIPERAIFRFNLFGKRSSVLDPVTSSIVARLNQPGGNVTGFATFEPSLGGKWLELLSEIAPGLKRAGIVFNPDAASVSAYM